MSTFIEFPTWGWRPDTTPSFSTHTLDANTDDVGFVFQVPEAATITTIGWRQGTLTGTPGTLRVGLQGVSTTTGRQDGTYLGGATNYVDYNSWAAGNNNTFIVHTLPSSVSLTRGQLVCLYLDPQAVGTWNASNNVTVTRTLGSSGRKFNRPYSFANATIDNFEDEVYLLRSSTKTYGNPIQTWTNTNLTSSTNPDEIGLAFTISSTEFSTYTVVGMRVGFTPSTAGATYDMRISQNTTVLQTQSLDSDQGYRFATNTYELYFSDTTLATLNTGTEYIASIKGTNAVNVGMAYTTMPTANDITAYSTETIRYAQRQTTGSWSFTNDTRVPWITLLIQTTAFSGGGSGGLLVHPGMGGGMRG